MCGWGRVADATNSRHNSTFSDTLQPWAHLYSEAEPPRDVNVNRATILLPSTEFCCLCVNKIKVGERVKVLQKQV